MRGSAVRFVACSIIAVGLVITPARAENPGGGVKLQPGVEQGLQWGKPANGLRGALAIRPSSEKPKAGDPSDLYLVLQNVSEGPIRYRDTSAASRLSELRIKIDHRTQLAIVDKSPGSADVLLQPREAVFLLVFPPDPKNPNSQSAGSQIAEGALEDAHQTMIVELRIEPAREVSWNGKLVTGETSGAVAAGKAKPESQVPRGSSE